MRVRLAPVRTCVALAVIGAILTAVRNLLFNIPLTPIRAGLSPFLVMSILGATHATGVFAWLAIRRLFSPNA